MAPRSEIHVETNESTAPRFNDEVAREAEKSGVTVDEVVATRLTEDHLFQKSKEALPTLWSKTGYRFLLMFIVMAVNQAAYGIDWGVISSINSNEYWHEYYGFGNSGPVIGTINALMTIGSFCGAPFLALSDKIGRRSVNFIGNFLTCIAAIIQAFAPNTGVLIFGRFLLGFGTALCTSSQYIAEVAPPHLRGRVVGVFGAFFQVGSLGMVGASMAFTNWKSDWSWRCAFLIQAAFPAFVCITIYFLCPESPRYMMMKGQREKARKMIMEYFTTSDDPNHPFVNTMMAQIDDSIDNSATGFRATWDFRVLFVRASWFRLLVLVLYSIFQQWNGGGIIGMYVDPALQTVGITDKLEVLGINLGNVAIYFVFTLVGSFLVDIFRRRTLIFAGLISIILAQIAVTITSWQFTENPQRSTAILTVFWMYTFQVCSALFIATMHNLYPVELLSLPLRAKGMALYSMVQGIAGTVHNYGIAVGIRDVGFKIWSVYIVYNFLQLIAAYFVFPETSKLNLEEIDHIFETPGANPVKLSVKIADAKYEAAKLEKQARRNGESTTIG